MSVPKSSKVSLLGPAEARLLDAQVGPGTRRGKSPGHHTLESHCAPLVRQPFWGDQFGPAAVSLGRELPVVYKGPRSAERFGANC